MVKMTVLKNKNIKFIYKEAFVMKKVIAILMVIFMLTVIFYGCRKGEVKDTTLSNNGDYEHHSKYNYTSRKYDR